MKHFKVERKYRTHPYSKTDGGVTVIVEFKDPDKPAREYPDVKRPGAFIKTIRMNDTWSEIAAAYIAAGDVFIIAADNKNKRYVRFESKRPDHVLRANGLEPLSRFNAVADRDAAWDALKKKKEKEK